MTAASDIFWERETADLLRQLETAPDGLTSTEAERRLRTFGHNAVEPRHFAAIPARVARKLAEPLILLLIVAAVVSGFTGDATGAMLIVGVVAASTIIDVVQEDRAERAAEALRKSVAIMVEVRRDGVARQVAAADVVPGDVVELCAGDLVPADGIVLASTNLFVNEALLTGEPYPVAKLPRTASAAADTEHTGALFMGTAVVAGHGTMLVAVTGPRTRFGGIEREIANRRPSTAFERGMHELGVLLLRLTILLSLFVLLVHLAFGRPAFEAFMFALALAVGLAPELLPMIVTVTLSRGALRMASRRVVVKRLAAIHDLGAMDVLCTDKTGTLTEAKISLVAHVRGDGASDQDVLVSAWLNSRYETGVRSPLDEAVLAAGASADAQAWAQTWRKLDELPFDFERRRVSVLVDDGSGPVLSVKGAPEDILHCSTRFLAADGREQPLDTDTQRRLRELHDAYAADGLRLLGVARRRFDPGHHRIEDGDEGELVFLGYVVFQDPPKSSAKAAIAALAASGIAVKIVSGDNEMVVRHLVSELKLGCTGLLTGAEIAKLDEPALMARVKDTDLFCRVTPAQKTRIIRALRAGGSTVGFLGDGANDAPALRAADVGLSVPGATDVARAAADIILLDQDLAVINDGVVEGRRTFANIQKYLRMGTSSNFGNMLSMAIASLFLPFLPMLPVQILLNNMLYDVSELGIPFDRVDPRDTASPQHWSMAPLMRFTMIMGAVSSVFDIATFGLLLAVFKASPELFRTCWFLESMATQILVIFVIRTPLRAWTDPPHPWLTTTSLGALTIAVVLALVPLVPAFGFVMPSVTMLAAVAALTVGYLAAAEALKGAAMRGLARSPLHVPRAPA